MKSYEKDVLKTDFRFFEKTTWKETEKERKKLEKELIKKGVLKKYDRKTAF